MQSIEQLKKGTMRRVYAIWFARTVASPAAVKIALFAAVVWRLKEYVSLRHVIANAPSLTSIPGNFFFFEAAFFHTQLVVQGLVVASLALVLWFMRDIIRGYAMLVFRPQGV